MGMSLRAQPDSLATEPSVVRRWMTPVTVSLLLVALTTAFLWAIQPQLEQDHLIFIYFVPTTLIALRYGSLSAMGVTIASSLAAAYFLYPPNFSFAVGSRLEFMELVLFSLLAMLASQVVAGFANDRDVAKRQRPVAAAPLNAKWPALGGLLSRLRAKIALF
jgi:K+-sensing histidine kinase KdpD